MIPNILNSPVKEELINAITAHSIALYTGNVKEAEELEKKRDKLIIEYNASLKKN
jgi:hypothetical protein